MAWAMIGRSPDLRMSEANQKQVARGDAGTATRSWGLPELSWIIGILMI